jgi:hypothetical protein
MVTLPVDGRFFQGLYALCPYCLCLYLSKASSLHSFGVDMIADPYNFDVGHR